MLLAMGFMMTAPTGLQAAGTGGQHDKLVNDWLKLGNFPVQLPVYDSVKSVNGEYFGYADLLKYDFTDPGKLHPQTGESFNWNGMRTEWESIPANKSGFARAENRSRNDVSQVAYFATYIQTDRWMEARVKIESPQLFVVFLDGKEIGNKTGITADDEAAGTVEKTVNLEHGKHLLLVKSLKPAGNTSDWEVKGTVSFADDFGADNLQLTLSPKQIIDIRRLLEGKFVEDAELSPTGNLVMFKYQKVTPPDGEQENWAEIHELGSGRLVQTFRHADMSSVKWRPVGSAVSYTTRDKDKGSSLWLFDLNSMQNNTILTGVKDLAGYSWSPDGSFIIYAVSEEPNENDHGLKRLEGMPDRWPWWRNRSFLYQLDVKSGITRRLTYGHVSTNLQDISPDGKKLLFSQSIPDFGERPYSKQVLVELDLETLAIDTLWVKNQSGNCSYSPDGEQLLVLGSPETFGKTGVNLKQEKIPNDYDIQAYLYTIESGDVDPITFTFDPSVIDARWSRYDENKIYFLAADRTYRKLYAYDLNTRYFTEINTGYDVVDNFSLADQVPVAACTGSSISTPPYASSINLDTETVEVIANPLAGHYRDVVFGKTEDWNFRNDSGVVIEGRIYYPPNFDKKKKYPLIVYYYGGTSPTERSFGGRYPLNMFAAQGYVVYDLQPSGATGYGQDFSAAHVNNWGITVADEIIRGTKLFVKDHDFVEKDKIGCIGASYGGFMTMLLQTRTDIFAAAISHAGISSIAGYWGEGYWGYLYNAVAAAGSFPWNNPELYVEQSALYHADKITTPLLLLHGGADTNVPIGESLQLYTALKLLGRPVELVEVAGQNHHILDYKKRILWQKTIFAWFDYWLKDQHQWWNDLYPERNL